MDDFQIFRSKPNQGLNYYYQIYQAAKHGSSKTMKLLIEVNWIFFLNEIGNNQLEAYYFIIAEHIE